jgi:hypothetical protein
MKPTKYSQISAQRKMQPHATPLADIRMAKLNQKIAQKQ